MPQNVSCVCGYRWCDARDVCSWAWTRVDATEGAFHVQAGESGLNPNEEYLQFRQAREVRQLRIDREVIAGGEFSGYHRPGLSERTPPTVPQWQMDVFRQWLDDNPSILDVEDPS